MGNFKRRKPNPKHDAYLGWTAEGRLHGDRRRAPFICRDDGCERIHPHVHGHIERIYPVTDE